MNKTSTSQWPFGEGPFKSAYARSQRRMLAISPHARSHTDVEIVLASRSPRRQALLRSALVAFRVVVPETEELFVVGETPRTAALRIAAEKAWAVDIDEVPILAADTVVAVGGDLLGKPATRDEAIAMIKALAGREHAVTTGVVARLGTDELSTAVTTSVWFRELSDAEIEAYVDRGESFDKAGGYGIQGEGGALVAKMSGSYTNVVGLPLEETLALLRSLLRGPPLGKAFPDDAP
jgi:septum formation protein